ncbi:MAG: ABC transporter substrate-binding protein [Flavobacteriaceae bacterium]|nr:ABC transporter substrate-binding protein [Flavobacteriaceae bacterium]
MKVLKVVLSSMILLAQLSCSKGVGEASSKETKGAKEAYFSYEFNDGADTLVVNVNKTPEKAVLFSHFMTEMFLALGLGDKIEEAYDKIPVRLKGHHAIYSKEEFLLSGVDFVSGWDGAIKAEATGTPQELIDKGIYPFIAKAVRDNETLETVYEDFYTLGKIFKVEKNAEKVVSEMKAKLENAQKNFIKKENKPKVLVFSVIENGLYISAGLTTDLINKAGGQNVYADQSADHVFVSYESLVDRNPDIIIIADMEGEGRSSYEEKKKALKDHPALKNLPAVKNDNIHKIALEDISPGVRNIDFIIKLNKLLYEK